MFNPEKGFPRVVPFVLYRDLDAAVTWLKDVLGFSEVVSWRMPDGRLGFADLEARGFRIQVGWRDLPTPSEHGNVSSMTLVFVDDVDVVCSRAKDAGGAVVEDPSIKPWGLRQGVIADPAGHQWEISEHVRDVEPEEWGAERAPRDLA